MTRALGRAALALALSACGACGAEPGPAREPSPPPSAFVSAEPAGSVAPAALSPLGLFAHVHELAGPSYQGRKAGTAGERAAAAYVRGVLERAGVEPFAANGAWEQPFAIPGGASVNVVGRVRARASKHPGEVVVLGAHLDHLGVVRGELHPGADDNASGVAVLLDVATHLAAHPEGLGRDVVMVAFGAEEVGLLGSQAFVASPPVAKAELVVMLNLDMLARPLMDQPLFKVAGVALGIEQARAVAVDGVSKHPVLRGMVDRACRAQGHVAIGVDDLPGPLQKVARDLSRDRSDSASFERAGIPAIFLSSGESSDYHRPTDDARSIDPELLATRAAIVLELVTQLSSVTRPF